MKIDYHLYQLQFKEDYGSVGKARARQGALLRISFDDGMRGYCDCHPWVELGDLPLSRQLAALSMHKTTPLLKRSLYYAHLDAEARNCGQSLFKNIQIPLSHQMVHLSVNLNELYTQEITHFKVKVGNLPEQEIATMKSWIDITPEITLRLDFNQKLTRRAFLQYWLEIPMEVKMRIDFVEDPYPFDADAWAHDQKLLMVSFAADHCFQQALDCPQSADYCIYKPALKAYPILTGDQIGLVVTSYLDHPLGQMCAAYTAAQLKTQYPDQIGYCGLLTHKCYEENLFISSVKSIGPQLLPPEGTGFGFDNLLKDLQWQRLR